MASLQNADRFTLLVSLCVAAVPLGCGDEVGSQTATASESSSGDPATDSDSDDPSASGVTLDPSAEDSSGSSSSDSTDTDPPIDTSGTTGTPECDGDAACDDDAPCTEDRCVDGQCESTALDGVPAPDDAQTAGDCVVVTCTAGAPTDENDDADVPVDRDACTMDVCTDGVPSNPPIEEGMCVPEADCVNLVDDDLDGAADCLDSDCDGIDGCELATELTCNGGFDNDADGDADCLDSDCDGIDGCELFELTCNDGFDNDGDGSQDCLDLSCDGNDGCELGTELTCNDGIDNDGDADFDCSDADCEDFPACNVDEHACNDGVDNDLDGLLDAAEPQCSWVAAALPGCPAGNLHGYSAVDLPQVISAAGTSTRNSYIPVALGGTLAGVAVRLDITHTYDSDLDITLFSPTSTSRELSTDNGGAGGSGDNFTNTVFADNGPGVIGSGGFDNPPYTGTYQPEQAFAPTLVGETTDGDWNLRVFDQFNLDGGTFNTFQLAICEQ